jgi:hypothetical protein
LSGEKKQTTTTKKVTKAPKASKTGEKCAENKGVKKKLEFSYAVMIDDRNIEGDEKVMYALKQIENDMVENLSNELVDCSSRRLLRLSQELLDNGPSRKLNEVFELRTTGKTSIAGKCLRTEMLIY